MSRSARASIGAVALMTAVLAGCGEESGEPDGPGDPIQTPPGTAGLEIRGTTVTADGDPVPDCSVTVTATGPDAPALTEQASISGSEGIWTRSLPADQPYRFEASCPGLEDPDATLTGSLDLELGSAVPDDDVVIEVAP